MERTPEKIAEELALEQEFRGGAHWFYWIAALSLVNSLCTLSGNNWNFIVGLGITQVIDAFAFTLSKGSDIAKVFALACDIVIAGLFWAFGALSGRHHTWAFYLGMTLYTLDGFLFLFLQDWLSVGFHAFALFGLYRGLQASNALSKLRAEAEATA